LRNAIVTEPPTPDPEEESPVADRAAESAARLVLSLVPVLGPALAEAVGFARTVYDDREAAAFRAEVKRRLASLEATGSGRTVKVSGDRARLLDLLVRRAGEETLRRVNADEAMQTLGLTADAYRRAVRELVDLGVVEADVNLNHASGYARAAVLPSVYVELIGRVDQSVEVGRELGLILRVLERAGEERRVGRDGFAALGIPVRRLQVLAEFLEERGLAVFRPPGFGDWMFYDAELTARGWRVLRGDEGLPGV
jgi:hypothetical protein